MYGRVKIEDTIRDKGDGALTAKQWLMRARNMEMRIAALQEAKERIYDRAVSITARPRETPSAGSSDHPGDKIAGYAVASAVVDEQIDKLNEVRAEILRVLGSIEDNVVSTVLTDYYVNGKSWGRIARERHYSYAYLTKDVHNKGLQIVENTLKNPNGHSAIMVLDKSPKA